MDLGEHILDVLVPLSGIGLCQVDREFNDAQCGYYMYVEEAKVSMLERGKKMKMPCSERM
jgi:hypothetical protein